MESNIENHRVRKVILYYYLEDGSMHAAEPKQDNSGIPQVCAWALTARGRHACAVHSVHARACHPAMHELSVHVACACARTHARAHPPKRTHTHARRACSSSATCSSRTTARPPLARPTSPWAPRSPSTAARTSWWTPMASRASGTRTTWTPRSRRSCRTRMIRWTRTAQTLGSSRAGKVRALARAGPAAAAAAAACVGAAWRTGGLHWRGSARGRRAAPQPRAHRTQAPT